MVGLTERSESLKLRAMKLQEAKQREALKKELKRQKNAEREEELIAKPAPSTK